jgi:hypothetical protein
MRLRAFCWLALTVLLVVETGARGDLIAIETANSPIVNWEGGFASANQSATVGWSFLVGANDISVTELGVFDASGNGLVNAH